jgi:hypothetical protein
MQLSIRFLYILLYLNGFFAIDIIFCSKSNSRYVRKYVLK